MRDLEELIPQLETIMREKAALEQDLASMGRAHAALEEQVSSPPAPRHMGSQDPILCFGAEACRGVRVHHPISCRL